MRQTLTRSALLLMALISAAARAESPDPAAIDALVDEALKAWQVPGAAVAVVHGEKVLYLKGTGVKDLQTRKPVTPDTVFPLASCTKGFTTTAMAMLVDEGKMGWDDPVRKHLPSFRLADPLADANVTLRDLVTHRTGLAGHDLLWYRSPWAVDEILRRISQIRPERSFRSGFQYQSIMFMAAGRALESASGETWNDFVRKRLFEPLGMTGATFTTGEAEKSRDRATGHRKKKNGEVEATPWYPMEAPNPAGSVNANARDLARWASFQLGDGSFRGKRLVSAANLGETHTPQTIIRLEGAEKALNPFTTQISYGMAWVIQDHRGQLLVSHAGSIDGFRCHITLVPRANLGIVILSNLQGTRMNLALSNSLVDLLLGFPHKDWNGYLAEFRTRPKKPGPERKRKNGGRTRGPPSTSPPTPAPTRRRATALARSAWRTAPWSGGGATFAAGLSTSTSTPSRSTTTPSVTHY
jgi:CubicO group peptidase (beta-lactamase class C family)